MAGTQRSSAMQFKDLSLRGKVIFMVAAAAGLAAGFLLPKAITVVLIAVVFVGGFVIQKVRGKS